MVRRSGATTGRQNRGHGNHRRRCARALRLLSGKLSWRSASTVRSLRDFLVRALPRAAAAQSRLRLSIRNHANAAMDVSDGFAGDLVTKLCAASGVSATGRCVIASPVECRRSLLRERRGRRTSKTSSLAATTTKFICAIPENRWASFAARHRKSLGVAVTCVGKCRSRRVRAPIFVGTRRQAYRAETPVIQPLLTASWPYFGATLAAFVETR